MIEFGKIIFVDCDFYIVFCQVEGGFECFNGFIDVKFEVVGDSGFDGKDLVVIVKFKLIGEELVVCQVFDMFEDDFVVVK